MLVARYFFENGYQPTHILEDGDSIDQVELLNILLDSYYPNRNQISLLPEENYNDENELYRKAYKLNRAGI